MHKHTTPYAIKCERFYAGKIGRRSFDSGLQAVGRALIPKKKGFGWSILAGKAGEISSDFPCGTSLFEVEFRAPCHTRHKSISEHPPLPLRAGKPVKLQASAVGATPIQRQTEDHIRRRAFSIKRETLHQNSFSCDALPDSVCTARQREERTHSR
jgi:hypothetical protein